MRSAMPLYIVYFSPNRYEPDDVYGIFSSLERAEEYIRGKTPKEGESYWICEMFKLDDGM